VGEIVDLGVEYGVVKKVVLGLVMETLNLDKDVML
jgi:hypothetical protein